MHPCVETIWVILQVLFEFMMSMIRWFLPTKYKSVKDEICLVTGSGSGIGRLMALEFARKGAIMVLWDVDETGNKETTEKIRNSGWKAFCYKCDVSNSNEVHEVARKVREEVGDVTILVNNAGVFYGKGLMNSTNEEIERTMKVNSLAHFWTVREFLPGMLEKNHGHIVTIASVLGLFAGGGVSAYTASKHAAVGFSKSLEYDVRILGNGGIQTTLVCPYHITTGLFTGVGVRFPKLLPSLTPEECVTAIMHAVLTNRLMVAIPRSMYLSYNTITWVPEKALFTLNNFFGASESMKSFVPTRPYQKEASKRSRL